MSFKLKSFFVIVIGNLLIILFVLRKSDLIWIPTFLEYHPKISSYHSTSETNLSFHEKFMNERNWSKYLLEIDALLSKIEAGQAQIPTDMERTTDGLHTELSVTNASSFEVGDVVEGFIQAKDHYGRNKKHGGDYFRARLLADIVLFYFILFPFVWFFQFDIRIHSCRKIGQEGVLAPMDFEIFLLPL